MDELMDHLRRNDFNMDAAVVAAIYKRTGVWPDVERVMKQALIRNLRHGFIHVRASVKVPHAELERLAVETGVFLVRRVPMSSIMDVWGPSDAAVATCVRRLIALVHNSPGAPRRAQQ